RRHTRSYGDWSSDVCSSDLAEVFGEADGDGGDCSGLYDEEECPAVEKAPERRERLAQIDVLPARLRHHRRKLSVRERGHHGQKRSEERRVGKECRDESGR